MNHLLDISISNKLTKIDDLDSCGWRCNIRVVDLTKGSEVSDSFFIFSAILVKKCKAFQDMKELLKKMDPEDDD